MRVFWSCFLPFEHTNHGAQCLSLTITNHIKTNRYAKLYYSLSHTNTRLFSINISVCERFFWFFASHSLFTREPKRKSHFTFSMQSKFIINFFARWSLRVKFFAHFCFVLFYFVIFQSQNHLSFLSPFWKYFVHLKHGPRCVSPVQTKEEYEESDGAVH